MPLQHGIFWAILETWRSFAFRALNETETTDVCNGERAVSIQSDSILELLTQLYLYLE